MIYLKGDNNLQEFFVMKNNDFIISGSVPCFYFKMDQTGDASEIYKAVKEKKPFICFAESAEPAFHCDWLNLSGIEGNKLHFTHLHYEEQFDLAIPQLYEQVIITLNEDGSYTYFTKGGFINPQTITLYNGVATIPIGSSAKGIKDAITSGRPLSIVLIDDYTVFFSIFKLEGDIITAINNGWEVTINLIDNTYNVTKRP